MNRETAGIEEEGRTGFSSPISLRIPSHPEYVMIARLVVTQVGQLAGFEPEDIYDLKLAVTEAVTNVIRHASVDYFDIEYRARPGAVEITVTDYGSGFETKDLAAVPSEQGGFGLTVIKSLADEITLDTTPEGTRLRMIRTASSSVEGTAS